MTTENTQAAVDATPATATPVAPVNDAQNKGDDLDALLSEFEASTNKPPVSPPQPEAAAPKPSVIDDERLRRVEQRIFEEDIGKTLGNIFADVKGVSERLQRAFLDQMARENPVIGQKFLNKATNPQEWARVEKALAKEAAKEFRKSDIDEHVTEDVAAAAAVVRGASTRPPPDEQPDFSSMTNAELREWGRKNRAQIPV